MAKAIENAAYSAGSSLIWSRIRALGRNLKPRYDEAEPNTQYRINWKIIGRNLVLSLRYPSPFHPGWLSTPLSIMAILVYIPFWVLPMKSSTTNASKQSLMHMVIALRLDIVVITIPVIPMKQFGSMNNENKCIADHCFVIFSLCWPDQGSQRETAEG